MKITQYQCNLCGIKQDTMNSVVKSSKSILCELPPMGTGYVLSVREDSEDFHLCRTCIDKLENTFKKTPGYSPKTALEE